jgi:hypothetical protein
MGVERGETDRLSGAGGDASSSIRVKNYES